MVRIDSVVGSRLDPGLSDRIHHLEHHDAVEYVRLPTADTARKRLRVTTDRGTDCAIAIPRSQSLFDGAVLSLGDDRAIVLRVLEERWLRLRPATAADALELGYSAGNLHWRVRFDGGDLLVALEGPVEGYLARIAPLIEAGRVSPVGPEPGEP
ncbi:urease accessory protein UreE [Microbaculum marinum]|uniref:Urease accessory protein UreE n=1 Tax=Microbaculum marinum TaxID=1764581 RepID=A0AAW9RJX9_9HYPH